MLVAQPLSHPFLLCPPPSLPAPPPLPPRQVLDLSCNEFDDAALGTVAAAARTAAGLSSLVLLGNKTPFSLPTLRALQQVRCWGASRECFEGGGGLM